MLDRESDEWKTRTMRRSRDGNVSVRMARRMMEKSCDKHSKMYAKSLYMRIIEMTEEDGGHSTT